VGKGLCVVIAATGIEPLTTGLSLFVGAFCALRLSICCLFLRAVFCLHVLALLHRCYMERLWGMGVIVATLLQVFHKNIVYFGCGLFYGLPLLSYSRQRKGIELMIP
jgi:hypothetical protein